MTGMWRAHCGRKFKNDEIGCALTIQHTIDPDESRIFIAQVLLAV